MKAYEIRAATGFEALTPVDRPVPVAGERQALVRVYAASLNYRDLLVVQGSYSRKLPLPLVPLSDAAGEVVEVGAGVTRVAPGDRIMPIFMPAWTSGPLTELKARSALGAAVDGVLAEYLAVHEDSLVRVPDHLSYEEASTLPCAAVTAWHALVTHGRVAPGATVLVLGSGGVSVFALQIAAQVGARVVATSKSDDKRRRLEALGAVHTINYLETPAWDDAVRAWTNGVGVDHVVEVGGVATFPRSLRAVRMGGRISLIGNVSGSGEVSFVPIFMRGLTVQGVFVGSRDIFEELTRFISSCRLQPVVDRVFGLDEVIEAYRYMASGAHLGKIVITL
jgi:NADPH:quinone reductase-like Zn-dependent oxidoreductase